MLQEGELHRCTVTEIVRHRTGPHWSARVTIGTTGALGSVRDDDLGPFISSEEMVPGTVIDAKIIGHEAFAQGVWYDLAAVTLIVAARRGGDVEDEREERGSVLSFGAVSTGTSRLAVQEHADHRMVTRDVTADDIEDALRDRNPRPSTRVSGRWLFTSRNGVVVVASGRDPRRSYIVTTWRRSQGSDLIEVEGEGDLELLAATAVNTRYSRPDLVEPFDSEKVPMFAVPDASGSDALLLIFGPLGGVDVFDITRLASAEARSEDCAPLFSTRQLEIEERAATLSATNTSILTTMAVYSCVSFPGVRGRGASAWSLVAGKGTLAWYRWPRSLEEIARLGPKPTLVAREHSGLVQSGLDSLPILSIAVGSGYGSGDSSGPVVFFQTRRGVVGCFKVDLPTGSNDDGDGSDLPQLRHIGDIAVPSVGTYKPGRVETLSVSGDQLAITVTSYEDGVLGWVVDWKRMICDSKARYNEIKGFTVRGRAITSTLLSHRALAVACKKAESVSGHRGVGFFTCDPSGRWVEGETLLEDMTWATGAAYLPGPDILVMIGGEGGGGEGKQMATLRIVGRAESPERKTLVTATFRSLAFRSLVVLNRAPVDETITIFAVTSMGVLYRFRGSLKSIAESH